MEKRCQLYLKITTDSWRVDETCVKVRRFGACENSTLRVARLKAHDRCRTTGRPGVETYLDFAFTDLSTTPKTKYSLQPRIVAEASTFAYTSCIMNLRDAQDLVAVHPAWAEVVQNAKPLHDAMEEFFEMLARGELLERVSSSQKD